MEPTRATETACPAGVTLSVVINNFNYRNYVGKAIESLLEQGPEGMDIIVVDDCSTDDSREVISRYVADNPGRIRTVFQPVNSGQGAGFNAGYAISRGELVMFLDADDFMLPGAAAIIRASYDPETTVYSYRMHYTNPHNEVADGLYPPLHEKFAQGMQASEDIRRNGRYKATITSGLVFGRHVLEKVMPMDPQAFRYGGDGYLVAVAPLYGPVRGFDTPICAYRLHQRQHTSRREEQARLARWRISHDQERHKAMSEHAARLGLPVAEEFWTRDDQYIFERIVSMVFEPEQHPIKEDALPELIRRLTHLQKANRRGVQGFLTQAFYTSVLYAPPALKYRLMRLKLDPGVRPEWMKRMARFLRRRLNIHMP